MSTDVKLFGIAKTIAVPTLETSSKTLHAAHEKFTATKAITILGKIALSSHPEADHASLTTLTKATKSKTKTKTTFTISRINTQILFSISSMLQPSKINSFCISFPTYPKTAKDGIIKYFVAVDIAAPVF
ncbi:MAG: hypothetical protein KKC46_12330 [Proteobacteria bacterium]|nr:hypothetical protein [Pseudomonadota bacterium]